MHRPDPFETRLLAAVRTFADDADTRVDAVAMAERARRLNRTAKVGWLRRIAFAAAAAAVVAVTVLGWLDFHQRAIVGPAPTPTPSAAPSATPTSGQSLAVTATVLPGGWVHVTGTEKWIQPSALGTTGADGRTTGIEIATSDQADYPGATGTGTLSLSTQANRYLWWGTYRLETQDGVWEGTCRGYGNDGWGWPWDLSCWLEGRGGHAGFTYGLDLRGTASGLIQIQGLIYPGSPPEP